MSLPVTTAAALAALPGVRHAFFTRQGGISTGVYTSLNCGPGSADEAAAVQENRRRSAAALGIAPDHLVSLYQVHGRDVVEVSAPFADRPKADGLVTRTKGLALGILTADCVPVLLADATAGVIGACHAGWKGALLGVTDATIDAMLDLGARRERIVAAIGPAIRQASYEVGPEFPAPFLAESGTNSRYFTPSSRAGHHQFDLTGYLLAKLSARSLARVSDVGHDTRTDAERYFSYRRTTLAGEKDYGRQLSAIALSA